MLTEKEQQVQAVQILASRKIDAVFNGTEYKPFLKFASHFSNLSLTNVALLYAQNPSATLVCGSGAWGLLGGTVKDDEKPLVLLAPVCENDKITYDAVPVYDLSQIGGNVKLPEKPKYDYTILCDILTEKIRSDKQMMVAFNAAQEKPIRNAQIWMYPDCPPQEKLSVLLSLYLEPEGDAVNDVLQQTTASSIDYLCRLYLDLPPDVNFPYIDMKELADKRKVMLTASLEKARELIRKLDEDYRSLKEKTQINEREEPLL